MLKNLYQIKRGKKLESQNNVKKRFQYLLNRKLIKVKITSRQVNKFKERMAERACPSFPLTLDRFSQKKSTSKRSASQTPFKAKNEFHY